MSTKVTMRTPVSGNDRRACSEYLLTRTPWAEPREGGGYTWNSARHVHLDPLMADNGQARGRRSAGPEQEGFRQMSMQAQITDGARDLRSNDESRNREM